ncbi:unnamed protein product [Ixodes persulcatus]
MKAVFVVAIFCLALSVTMAGLLKGALLGGALGFGLGALSRGGGYGGYGYGPTTDTAADSDTEEASADPTEASTVKISSCEYQARTTEILEQST